MLAKRWDRPMRRRLATMATNLNPIRGKVAKVLSRREVAPNESFCLASTYRKERVNVDGLGPIEFAPRLRSFGEPPKWETRIELFKTSEADQETLTGDEANVSSGDPVVQAVALDRSMVARD